MGGVITMNFLSGRDSLWNFMSLDLFACYAYVHVVVPEMNKVKNAIHILCHSVRVEDPMPKPCQLRAK